MEKSANVTPITQNAEEKFDPWLVEDVGKKREYSELNFYTRATDAKGFKDTLHVGVPPYVKGQIEKIVQQRQIPEYQTLQDFVRDAVVHRLKKVNDEFLREESIEEVVKQEIFASILETSRQRSDALEKLYRNFESLLIDTKERKDFPTMKEAITAMFGYVDNIPNPYNKKILDLIDRYKNDLKS